MTTDTYFKTVTITQPVASIDPLFTEWAEWPENWPPFIPTGWALGQTMGDEVRMELTFTFAGTAYRVGEYEGDDVIVDGTRQTTTAYQIALAAGMSDEDADRFAEALHELHRAFINAYRDASNEAKNVARDAAFKAIASVVATPQAV